MTQNILVAYGTTNGSTRRIAETVAGVLRERGMAARALPAAEVTSLERYDAVVVGGGLYGGRWHRDCRAFVRRHARALAAMPVWFFSSGPLDATASRREIPPVRGVRRAMERLGVTEHVTFGGCLEEGATGFIARRIVSSGKGGDFRDFARIEAWAAGIGTALETGRRAG
ncbi:flavodoxin domain-containing protein [Streptomyces sp. NPDC048566]|uniref:flavodoxin domain-containing protein n=1 Tax=Streptomyces sp. NPDC048566 TaxID=3365569 RepID=UPI0037134F4A